jgi:Cu(I)/Ag(I) efflux system protein CusF
MKHLVAMSLAAILAGAAFAASAQSGGMKDMPMKGMDMKTDKKDAMGATHKATGVVTKVEKNKITIKHEPVQSMNWPSMTMAFGVKDKAMLDKVSKDKKVEFEFAQQGKDYVITSIK